MRNGDVSALSNAVIASRIISRAADISALALQIGSVAPQKEMPSQRDPRWRDELYAGGLRFKTDGCYVCAYTYMVRMAGYSHTPPQVAGELREAGCFSGALFTHPELAQHAFPLVRYDGAHRWHDYAADMDTVFSKLEQGPIIAEVDFQWRTQVLNQHFVVLLQPTEDRSDIWIADPWDGSTVRLLLKYAGETWNLARCIYGLRIFRIED